MASNISKMTAPTIQSEVTVKYFKAQKKTNRFNENQVVFIVMEYGNHMDIRHKYRGRFRYVNGTIEKWHTTQDRYIDVIGEAGIKTMKVDSKFAFRHNLQIVEDEQGNQ